MADQSWWNTLSFGFSNFADGIGDFFSVGSTVSPSANMKPDDVLKTKSALNAVGSYKMPDYGLTDIPDTHMINGLKNFQANNGLKVDGIMKPGGPTENVLGKTLAGQGVSTADLLEKAKTPSITPTPKPDVPQPIATPEHAQTSWSASAPFGETAKPKKPQLPKIDPMTGLADPLASAPKGKLPTRKMWEEADKIQQNKATNAILPQGDTVQQRIQSMMTDKRYGDKTDPSLREHVQKQFERAYPGTVEFDETGKMIQPQSAIQPHEVEPFDPNGEMTRQYVKQEETYGQTGRNSAVYEKGTVSEEQNPSPNIRQEHAVTTAENSQPQNTGDQEVTPDSAEGPELTEVRDPVDGKLYRVDDYGIYHDEKSVPVSLSDDVQQRLDRQFVEDMQNEGSKKTAQDHPYQEKGKTKEFNADAFADKLNADAAPIGKGKGNCAKFVRRALEAGGFPKYAKNPGEAKDWGPRLEKNGYEPVDKESYVPQKGDVVVLQPYPGGRKEGHMAAYDGKRWVSDAIQRDMWGGPGYRKHKPPHVIYRKAR